MPRVRPIPEGFGAAQLVFGVVGDSRTPEITFGITDDTSVTPDAIATLIRTEWIANFVPASLATTSSLNKVMVTVNRGGDLLDGLDGNVSAGTASFNAVSLAVAMLLRKTTGMGGRANRGRCYLPNGYLGELSVDQAGVVDPTLVGATTTRWGDFIGALNDDNIQMVLLHSAISPAVPGAPTPVTGGFCETMVATQRRRQRKVGRGLRTGP
jgi:hypothetical protein